MSKLSVAICDDDEYMLLMSGKIAQEVFSSCGIECETEYFTDPARLAQAYKEKQYSLILLDIEMPGVDGISFAKALRAYEKESGAGRPADIIFISSHEEKVFDTFLTKPFSFIRKNKIVTEGKKILKLYADSLGTQEDMVEFKSGADYLRLSTRDILYVENSGHDQVIHLKGGKTIPGLRITIDKIEKMLSGHGFIRVHISFLVNWDCIQKIRGNEITITNGDVVPLSRSRKQEVLSEFMRMNREATARSSGLEAEEGVSGEGSAGSGS